VFHFSYEKKKIISLSLLMISSAYHGGPCFGMGDFNEGHGDVLRGNKCLLGLSTGKDDIRGDSTSIDTQKIRETALRKEYGYSTTGIDDEFPFVGRLWGGCVDSHVTLESNEYYTPDGIAMVVCHGDDFHELQDMATKFGLEVNSTVSVLPDVKTILEWAKSATRSATHQDTSSSSISTSLV
jgi:hypothetical protein